MANRIGLALPLAAPSWALPLKELQAEPLLTA
jgi:hypothetical protein